MCRTYTHTDTRRHTYVNGDVGKVYHVARITLKLGTNPDRREVTGGSVKIESGFTLREGIQMQASCLSVGAIREFAQLAERFIGSDITNHVDRLLKQAEHDALNPVQEATP